MTQEKLKGHVWAKTLARILTTAVEVDKNIQTGEITYWTGKCLFIARPKGTRYYNVFQVKGA